MDRASCLWTTGAWRTVSRRKFQNQQSQPTHGVEAWTEPRPHWWKASTLTTAPIFACKFSRQLVKYVNGNWTNLSFQISAPLLLIQSDHLLSWTCGACDEMTKKEKKKKVPLYFTSLLDPAHGKLPDFWLYLCFVVSLAQKPFKPNHSSRPHAGILTKEEIGVPGGNLWVSLTSTKCRGGKRGW